MHNGETACRFFNIWLDDEASYRVYFEQRLDELQRLQHTSEQLDVGCASPASDIAETLRA